MQLNVYIKVKMKCEMLNRVRMNKSSKHNMEIKKDNLLMVKESRMETMF